MREHHRQSLDNMVRYFRQQPGVVALIFGGSVARGEERPDSDLDADVVVTPERHAALKQANRLTEVIHGLCTYEGGYFDVKYLTKDFLLDAAGRGSEPARNAFRGARCLFTDDPDIPAILARIPVFQQGEKADKLLSFYSALALNAGYFWESSANDPYLRQRAVADIALYSLRLLLEDAEVLFPCHKSLMQTVASLARKPEGIVEKCERFLRAPDEGTKAALIDAVLGFIDYTPPADYAQVLTRYVDDNEQWWYRARPLVAEW